MARDSLYRRAFHSDRDLKGAESILELDRASVAPKASSDMRIFTADGGFEAPRNSLDVPFCGLLEMRRHSEVTSEDIPIGYELPRSLTTRRRNDEFSNMKPITPSSDLSLSKAKYPSISNWEANQKPHAPSIVARLMGLDALPHQENSQSSNHSSSRRPPQECPASYNSPTLSNQVCVSALPLQKDELAEGHEKEKVCYGELSFRNHPQEKQLQEFKREFSARQALQGTPSVSTLNVGGSALRHRKQQCLALNTQMDSEEFLDALDFLNTNKDFFVKILNDPNSLFAKHLQSQARPSPNPRDGLKHKGSKIYGKCSESRTESHASLNDLAQVRKKHEVSRYDLNEKAKVVRSFRWGRDEEMPVQLRFGARGGSVLTSGRTGVDELIPTRIVVLKPNLGKNAIGKLSCPASPLSHSDENLKMRAEGKESVKQNVKERLQLKNAVGVATEFLQGDTKDGLKDARDIARQIVKQVKEDMSHRLMKEASFTPETPIPPSYTAGRKPTVQRMGGIDATGACNGEAYYRASRDHGKSFASLPTSPRLYRIDGENELRHSCSTADIAKRNSHKSIASAKSSRDSSSIDEGGQGSCGKQIGVKDSKGVVGRKAVRNSSSKVRDQKCESPRVLPRSLSAPASASVENRTFECANKGETRAERTTSSTKAKPVENSLFKERLLSLKDSFSLTKKKSSRKLGPLQELCTPRQSDQEIGLPSEGDESSCMLSSYKWHMAEQPTENEEGLHQWASMTDLADSASETSLDKCEQPSPVSVLETPFQEDSTSSVDTRGSGSNCQELRHELSCLGLDQKNLRRNLDELYFSQPSSRHCSFDSVPDEPWDVLGTPLEGLDVYDSCVGEEELTYIKHILMLSGFSMDGLIVAQSPSERGLNPSIFERLEVYYKNRSRTNTSASKEHSQTHLNPSSRRLLFDVVDEIVFFKLKKPRLQPWLKRDDQRGPVKCTGKQLLEHILAHISYYSQAQSETEDGILDDVASKDILREAAWKPSQCDVQMVVIELERLVCGDLIREIVHEYVRR